MIRSARLRAVIFDLDGVLCDSEPLHTEAWLEVLAELGHVMDGLDTAGWIGVADQEMVGMFRRDLGLLPASADVLCAKRERYVKLADQKIRPDSAITQGVLRLFHRSIPLAVATSSSRCEAERSLSRVQLVHLLTTLVTAEDVGSQKPDPEPYQLAAGRLGVAPHACLVIEDSPAGIESARRAGCAVCAVAPLPLQHQLPEADYVVASTVEALRLADELVNTPC
jgi:HAD superfamily hydrolase (TIGR01509 family)